MSTKADSVLYDAPGPKTIVRHRIFSVVGTACILAAVAGVAVAMDNQGQLAPEKWAPLLNPGHESFPLVWKRLGNGLLQTLRAAGLAILLSTFFGTAFAVIRHLMGKTAALPLVGFMELLRGLPVVIMIFLSSRVLPAMGVKFEDAPGGEGLWYLLIGLTAYNSVVIAEALRAGIAALPKGQAEAATAIGLSRWQSLRIILLPQAVKLMLPALVSQIVVIVKDTSLAGLLGLYPELLKAGKEVGLALETPLQVYIVIGIIYIALNMAVSAFANFLQARQQ